MMSVVPRRIRNKIKGEKLICNGVCCLRGGLSSRYCSCAPNYTSPLILETISEPHGIISFLIVNQSSNKAKSPIKISLYECYIKILDHDVTFWEKKTIQISLAKQPSFIIIIYFIYNRPPAATKKGGNFSGQVPFLYRRDCCRAA